MRVRKDKPLVGVGVRDIKEMEPFDGIKELYEIWKRMIYKCYREDKNEISVQEDWLTFSKFTLWAKNQDYENKKLFLKVKASIYSPENCFFDFDESLDLSKRKLYSGVGLFDLDYKIERVEYSKIYAMWVRLLKDCYSKGKKSDKGWTVCGDWLTYSNFKEWCLLNDWEGKILCRNKISEENTVYDSDNCHFVDKKIGRKEYDSERKLYSGVGFDDLLYSDDDNQRLKRIWQAMLRRCYSNEFPAYAGCTVCEEWHRFSNFKNWMVEQSCEGKVLDKDLLFKGNKIYSPEKCILVDRKINQFLSYSTGLKGYYNPDKGSYDMRVNDPITGKRNLYLGTFDTKEEATEVWRKAKHEFALRLADQQTDERVANALRVWFTK